MHYIAVIMLYFFIYIFSETKLILKGISFPRDNPTMASCRLLLYSHQNMSEKKIEIIKISIP